MNRHNQNDDVEIRGLLERWAAAVRARDLPTILDRHAHEMLMFDVPPPTVLRGIEAYERSWGPFFASFAGAIAFDLSDVSVHAGSEVAFVTALVRCAGEQTGGGAQDLAVRLTVGLRKIAGQWTILHEHHSVESP
jgi:ketosteroid isomerase-like protein